MFNAAGNETLVDDRVTKCSLKMGGGGGRQFRETGSNRHHQTRTWLATTITLHSFNLQVKHFQVFWYLMEWLLCESTVSSHIKSACFLTGLPSLKCFIFMDHCKTWSSKIAKNRFWKAALWLRLVWTCEVGVQGPDFLWGALFHLLWYCCRPQSNIFFDNSSPVLVLFWN